MDFFSSGAVLDQSNEDVARSLDISTGTVKTHLENTFAKLDVQQRWQAAELARWLGLLDEHLRRGNDKLVDGRHPPLRIDEILSQPLRSVTAQKWARSAVNILSVSLSATQRSL